MKNSIFINNRPISEENSPYIIAEISANHNGSLQNALNTIKAAKETGVDAVKIQTYTPDSMTIDTNNKDFVIKEGLWKNRTLYDLYSEGYTPYEWHKQIFDFAKNNDITLFSTPFDEEAVDLLDSFNVPAYKISSFELVDLPLISYVAKKNKPILLSTGMASLNEVRNAVETAKKGGCQNIVIFHCISGYPTPIEHANLNGIKTLKEEFGINVGLSDHTLGILSSITAVSLGVSVIEKHFTLSRASGGLDSAFSLEPKEMESLVKDVNLAYLSLGKKNHLRSEIESTSKTFRRSIYFVTNPFLFSLYLANKPCTSNSPNEYE